MSLLFPDMILFAPVEFRVPHRCAYGGKDRLQMESALPSGFGNPSGSYKSKSKLRRDEFTLGPLSFFDRRADKVAVFRPTPVVILYVRQAKEVFENNPCVA